MNLSENELELLDRYLDGDLAEAEAVGLEARLADDADLAAELSRLREQRAARADAFASLEPDDAEAQRLQWYIRGAIHQVAQGQVAPAASGVAHPSFGDRARWAINGLSKIAAVLLVGFVVGYGYRDANRPTTVAPNNGGGGGVAIVDPALTGGGRITAGSGGGADFDPDAIRTVSSFPADPVAPSADGYVVSLRDQMGNVIATKKFRTLQEARDFTADLERWQQRYRQVQKNGVRFIGDDF